MDTTTMSREQSSDSAPGAPAEPRQAASRRFGVERDSDVPEKTVGTIEHDDPVFSCRGVNVFYADKQAIYDVNLDIGRNEVISMIGPSGCGKSTFLRCLNRMNDTIDIARVTGSIELEGEEILDSSIDVVPLRARVGMVFQKPNPFPKSIYENVAYGPRIHGLAKDKIELDEIVHRSLDRAGLIKEVKDRLVGSSNGCALLGPSPSPRR